MPQKDQGSLLSATLSRSFSSTHTHTHTNAQPKSLARMTGDGQKQIMVIDRCLEMNLCVYVSVYVCQYRGWGLRAVCKNY